MPHKIVAHLFIIPGQVLWSRPNDAALVARLGALANALLSVMSLSTRSVATGVGRLRDTLQVGLLMASYLKEAIDALDNRRTWELIEKGTGAGFKLPKPLDHYRGVFSRGKGSLYKRVLYATRNQKGFHIDEEHFKEWAKNAPPMVTLWRRDSPSPLDWAFTVSLQIQSFYGVKMEESHVDELRDTVQFSDLVVAMGVGLVAEMKIDPSECWRALEWREVHIRYEDNSAEVIPAIVDSTGDLHANIDDLRRHMARKFRVPFERTGARYTGTDEPLRLIARGRRATAVAGPAIDAPETYKPPDRLKVLQHLTQRGQIRTDQFLKLLTAVRAGEASANDIDKAIADLNEDATFWNDWERQHDEAVKRSRGSA